MPPFRKGRYLARFADSDRDLRAAQSLRRLAFRGDAGRGAAGADGAGDDADAFDEGCRHMLVEDVPTGDLVCCFRLLRLDSGAEIKKTYSAQYYELSALAGYAGPMVEMGRFCIRPDAHDPDILRIAWAAMTRYVDATGAELLFGCSSFKGTQATDYLDAFALLQDRHLAPKRFWPRIKAPNVIRFAQKRRRGAPDERRAMRAMPPLLRSYLAMGGWVSDHAVLDGDLNTLHVFTGLEVKAIPVTRKRLLRSTAN